MPLSFPTHKPLVASELAVFTVGGSALCYFLADGCSYSVGVLFNAILKAFKLPNSVTAVVPGFIYGLPLMSSIFVCPLVKAAGPCAGVITAVTFLFFSYMVSSFVKSFYPFAFLVGLVASVGLELTYVSALFAVEELFTNHSLRSKICLKHSLSLGITVAGSGLGTIIFNPFLNWLLDTYDWHGAMKVEAAIFLHLAVVYVLFRGAKKRLRLATSIVEQCWSSESLSNDRPNVPPDELQFVTKSDSSDSVGENIECAASGNADVPPSSSAVLKECSFKEMHPVVSSINVEISLVTLVGSDADMKKDRMRGDLSSADAVKNHNQISTFQNKWLNVFERSVWDEFRVSMRGMLSRFVWCNWRYLTFSIAYSLVAAAQTVPWSFIYTEAVRDNLFTQTEAALLGSVMGAANTISQLLFGYMGDKVPPLILWTVIHLVSSLNLVMFAMDWSHRSRIAYVVLSVVFGLLSNQSLYALIINHIVGAAYYFAGLGICLAFSGVLCIIAPPLAGLSFDWNGNYQEAFFVASTITAIASIMVLLVALSGPLPCRDHSLREEEQ